MDPETVIQEFVQSGFYSKVQKNQFLKDISEMKSQREIFEYLVNQVKHSIDEKKELANKLPTNKEVRKLLKPELQIWLIKAKLSELLGTDMKES